MPYILVLCCLNMTIEPLHLEYFYPGLIELKMKHDTNHCTVVHIEVLQVCCKGENTIVE